MKWYHTYNIRTPRHIKEIWIKLGLYLAHGEELSYLTCWHGVALCALCRLLASLQVQLIPCFSIPSPAQPPCWSIPAAAVQCSQQCQTHIYGRTGLAASFLSSHPQG
jgi:hypothetical protein